MSSIAGVGKDGHEFKFEQTGPFFSTFKAAMPAKIPFKNIMVNLFIIVFITLQELFFVCVEGYMVKR